MLRFLMDEGLTRCNQHKWPARLLEAVVGGIPEAKVFERHIGDRAPIGIYIHIPFCATKCSFCGYSVELDKSAPLKRAYAQAVAKHLRRLAGQLRHHELTWVSFGGGTPSSLSPDELALIMDALNCFNRAVDVSTSMEMRVDSLLEEDKLARYLELGISRVSLGLQSFNDAERRSFGLRLTADEAYRLLAEVDALGVEYSLDVIWGGPGQTMRDLDVTFDRLFQLNPHQIDAYPLFPIEGTSLFQFFDGADAANLRAHQRRLCDHVVRRMAEAGYERIDGVMFSRTKDVDEDPRGGFREASSLLVPETGHIIGVGQSAHSLYNGTFATNPYSTRKYVEMIEQGSELVYTGTRAPALIAAFRLVVARLARVRRFATATSKVGRGPTEDDLEATFYSIRLWWHVFTGLRGWNALSAKVGYPIGNKNRVRLGVDAQYVTVPELAKVARAKAVRERRTSLPVVR